MTTSSIQMNSENTEPPEAVGSGDEEELMEIRAAIADASFMQNAHQQESSSLEAAVEDNFSAAVTRTLLERLRSLDIPISEEVRSLVAKNSDAQMESNISALEEESATKGLKSPIAAFKYFVSNNCQPRNDRQAWWNRAAAALGKQQRDRLIQSVTEYAGEVVVMFANGQWLSLTQVQGMSWEAISGLGRDAMSDTLFDISQYKSVSAKNYHSDYTDATGIDPAWDEPASSMQGLEGVTDARLSDASALWRIAAEFTVILGSGQTVEVKFIPGLESCECTNSTSPVLLVSQASSLTLF